MQSYSVRHCLDESFGRWILTYLRVSALTRLRHCFLLWLSDGRSGLQTIMGCGRVHDSMAWFVWKNAVLAPHIGNVISSIPENCIRTVKKGGDHKTAARMISAVQGCLQAALISFLGLPLMLICLGLSASGISRCRKMVRMPSTNCASSTFMYSARRNIFEKARLAIPWWI